MRFLERKGGGEFEVEREAEVERENVMGEECF